MKCVNDRSRARRQLSKQAFRRAIAESLECRRLLSISPASLTGPINDTGTNWTYQITNNPDGQTATYTETVVGPATFNGMAVTEVDTNFPSGAYSKVYYGYDSAGDYVTYGSVDHTTFGDSSTVEQPYSVVYPATMEAGVAYTRSYTDVETDATSGVVTTTPRTTTLTLSSETTSSITVPAATYDAYQVLEVDSDGQGIGSDGSTTDPSQTTSTVYASPYVGIIKATSTDASEVLTAFNDKSDHLAFDQSPTTTAAGKTIDPAVTVSARDAANNVDSSATGSITLTLASASRLGTSPGTLGGTATEPLVNGVATFSDLTVSADGTYQLTATDSDTSVTALPSGKFKIGSSDLKVEITTKLASKTRGGSFAKGVQPGDRILYSVLVTPTQTIDTANVVLTLPSGFVPAGITSGGVFAGDTITWTANTRLYDFDVTVPSVTTLAGLKQVVTSVDDNVTYTDGSTDEATTTNTVKIAVDNALEFVQNPTNIAVNQLLAPPVTVAVRDIYGEVDTSSSDTVRLGIKGSGMTGTLTAQAVDGVATFSDLHFARAGDFVLTARDLTKTTIKSASSTKFAVVSLRTIEGTIGTRHHISRDAGLTISDANVVAVPQSNGSMILEAAGLSEHSIAVLAGVKWGVVRNSADEVTSDDPSITPDANTPLSATLNLSDAKGSFNLICYYDSNKDGTYEAGEELRVFHLAEVAVVIQPGGSIVTSAASFYGKDYPKQGKSTVSSGSFGGHHFAITSTETVQVVGGGSDGMIGVSKIHVGWLQNGVGDSFVVTYKNDATRQEKLTHGKFPILDSTYDRGGSSIFALPPFSQDPVPDEPGPARDPVTGTDPSGGQDRTVATGDSPAVLFNTTYLRSPAVSTTGSNDFSESISAYSDDYSTSYAAYNRVYWSARFFFIRTASAVWLDGGSVVSASPEVDFAAGETTDSLGINTQGPLFNESVIVK